MATFILTLTAGLLDPYNQRSTTAAAVATLTVFQISRNVVTCDDRQAVLTTTMILLTTGSFCWVCDFLSFENRTMIEADMTKNVPSGQNTFDTWNI